MSTAELARLLTDALPPPWLRLGMPRWRRQNMLSRMGSVVFSAWLMAAISGCAPEEQITQYTIPKPESIQLPSETKAETASRPERMLGAILPHGEQAWFFKLTGPVEPVADRWDEFRELVKSVRFQADGNPDWTLPSGWTRQPGTQFRFATLTIDTKPPLEVSVSALPNSEDTVLANVNRWRGQLGLPPLTSEQLGDETESIATQAGELATVVNLVGTTKPGGMMSGPFARGGLPASSPLAPSTAPQVKYEAPEDWTAGRVGGMRKAAFEVREGDHRAEITVIDLPREAGDRLPNVNRWRGQVGLPSVTEEELKASMRPISVGSLTGDYVELIGQGDEALSILGVIVDRDDKTWFVKLQGPTPVALAQRPQFEAFVKSLTFE